MFASKLTHLLIALCAVPLVMAQVESTFVDPDSGQTLLVQVDTNAAGVATNTEVIQTLSPAAAAPAVVGASPTGCTTSGCPVPATIYTVSGVILTFVPTSPAAVQPTISSVGEGPLPVTAYITTINTAAGIGAGVHISPPNLLFSKWAGPAVMALVGGLIGVVAVL